MIQMLIVDDERIDREGVAYLIQRFAFPIETTMAKSADEALRILDSRPIDILFTDICMPEQNGLDLIRQAKERFPALECIIYSAYGEFEYAQKAIQHGVRRYILKPLKVQDFHDLIQSVLEDCFEKQLESREEQLLRLLLLGEIPETPFQPAHQIALIDLSKPLFADIHYPTEQKLKDYLMPRLYVSLNEYQAIMLADEKTIAGSHGFVEALEKDADTAVVIVWGGPVRDAAEILDVYAKMEGCLESKFFSRGSQVLDLATYTEEAGERHPQRLAEVEQHICRNEKMRAIAETEQLFEDLKQSAAMSPMYVKYLCSNLIHRCMETNSANDPARLSEYVNRLFQCADIYALKDVMVGILEEAMPDTDNDRNIIRQVLKIVEDEYMKDISLEQIADRVQLSPSYLSYFFKKETGRNFIKYLTVFRLEKAKELLRNTDIKIITISEMVGYLNSSYFCLLFKNYTGQTPARFREQEVSG